uniref:Uncharacterized protein n=1 Tax=Rhodnius prolixus TaxID=13249 RepID=T1IEV2_RHOPR
MGLSEFLALIACLLLAVPIAMSAPSGKPVWINPCGGKELGGGEGSQADTIPDNQLLTRIILASRNALAFAQKFSEAFVGNVFPGRSVTSHHEEWKHTRYDWLPTEKDIPKTLGETTPDHHLKDLAELELDAFLLSSYRYLQTISVGLEQVHHDKTRHSAQFSEEFAQAQFKLRQVLCEVESALTVRAPDIKIVDVTRTVMASEYRNMKDETYRDLRDWIIFRDYMNCLEYLTDVCEFFKKLKDN